MRGTSIQLPAIRAWIQGGLSAFVGLALGAYLLVLSVLDLPRDWFGLLVVAILLPSIAVVSGNIKRFLVTLILLDVSMLVLDIELLSQPINASVNGLRVSLTTISVIILYCFWVTELLMGRTRIDLYKRVSLPALCFLTAGVLSVHNSGNLILSGLELALNAELILMYFYLANYLQDLDDLRHLCRVILLGALIGALSVLLLYWLGGRFGGSFHFMGLGGDLTWFGSERIVRSGGFFGHPNIAGIVLVYTLMMALAVLLTPSSARLGKPLALASLALGGMALIVTFARGSWLNFSVAGLTFALLALRRKWVRWRHIVSLFAALGLFVYLFYEPIYLRLFTSDLGALYSRIPLNLIAIKMIKAHPWIGVGINNYMVVVKHYLTPETSRAWLAPVHNKFLLVWSETGVLGFLSFILFLLAVGKEAWRAYASHHPVYSPLGAALLASLCGCATGMMTARFGIRTALQVLWLIAAMSSGIRRLSGLSLERQGRHMEGNRTNAQYCSHDHQRDRQQGRHGQL